MRKKRIKRKTRKQVFPLPAFIPGERGAATWYMREAQDGEVPYMVNHYGLKGSFVVPAGDSKIEQWARAHELLHVAISPIEPPGDVILDNGARISAKALYFAEEFRVNLALRVKMGLDLTVPTKNWTARMANDIMRWVVFGDPDGFESVVNTHFAIWACDEEPFWELDKTRLFKAMDLAKSEYHVHTHGLGSPSYKRYQMLNAFIDNVLNFMSDLFWDELEGLFVYDDIPSYDFTLKLAQWLQTLHSMAHPQGEQGESEEDQELQEAMADDSEDLQTLINNIESQGGDEYSRSFNEMQDNLNQVKQGDMDNHDGGEGEVVWGHMEILERKKRWRLPKKKVKKSKYIATDEGTVPRFVHRILIDQQPFARKRKEQGGSVLIDDSGSMSWKDDEVEAVIQAAPGIVIAAYSGSGSKGQLAIIARDGRYASPDKDDFRVRPDGGNNIVDFPALEWLAKQEEPRIWVSDTYVVPVKGSRQKAFEQCLIFVRKNKINIVQTAREAAMVFQGKKAIHR